MDATNPTANRDDVLVERAGTPAPADARDELIAALLHVDTVAEMLQELVTRAASLSPMGSCSITLVEPRGAYSVVASDSLSAQVDEVQYTAGEGPCLTALDQGSVVDVPDLAAEDRWPNYRLLAVSHGVASCHCRPLGISGPGAGVLNLYARDVGAFGPQEREAAASFAVTAGALVGVTRRYAEKAQLSEQLAEALTSRSTIDQAIGIIMGQNRICAEDAFALLRRASQNRNVKLRDIAEHMTSTYGQQGGAPRPGPPTSSAPGNDPGRSRA